MAYLSEIGCFAYFFNSLLQHFSLLPLLLASAPVTGGVSLAVSTVLTMLASSLLFSTLEVRISQSKSPHPAYTFPSLFRRYLPRNALGKALYICLLVCTISYMLRSSVAIGQCVSWYIKQGKAWGLGTFMGIFVMGALCAASIRLQDAEGVQLACVLFNTLYCVSTGFLISTSSSLSGLPITPFTVFPWTSLSFSSYFTLPTIASATSLPCSRLYFLNFLAISAVELLYFTLNVQLVVLWPLQSDATRYIFSEVCTMLYLPFVSSYAYIHIRALSDVLIEWRYKSRPKPRYFARITAIRTLCPVLITLPAAFLAYIRVPNSLFSGMDSSLLSLAGVLFLIPYCVNRSRVCYFESTRLRVNWPKWPSYVVYAAGGYVLVGTVWYYWQALDWGKLRDAFGVECGVAVMVGVWTGLARVFP